MSGSHFGHGSRSNTRLANDAGHDPDLYASLPIRLRRRRKIERWTDGFTYTLYEGSWIDHYFNAAQSTVTVISGLAGKLKLDIRHPLLLPSLLQCGHALSQFPLPDPLANAGA